MRYVCSARAPLVLALSAVFGASCFAQTLSITNYQFVSEQRVTLTKSRVTYRADLVNAGPAAGTVTATVASSVVSVEPVAGQNKLHFSNVTANSQIASDDTFVILVDRTVPFSFTNLTWTFQTAVPIANAGRNQTAKVGFTVTLDGSGSTNPSGIGTLTYSWAFATRPGGSAAMLNNPTGVMPTFVPDVPGDYQIALTVSNGVLSDTAKTTVSTTGTAPVANAGANQTVAVGSTAVLNGSASTSVDGRTLSYAWTLKGRPAGSSAALTGANTVSPTFVADKSGTYTAELVVNDGMASAPASVTISTQPVKPVANAGANQVVNVNSVVELNGAGSTDANGYPLTYHWSLIAVADGSAAALSNPTAVKPTFTADRPGTYIAQLIVNNGVYDSAAATTTVTTNPILAPTANAGQNQTVTQNQTVHLNGSGTDPQGLTLSYAWSLINKPQGSAAALTSGVIANPDFTADLPGTYIAQLIVSNGYSNSAAATVTISTVCTPPTSNPGATQSVPAGATVTLDGSASGDACRDPLTYSWSFTAVPDGSKAALAGAKTVSPTFVADLAGTYVAQLIVNNGYANSTPVTVTILAQALTLTPNPLNLTNASGTLTLSSAIAAGQGGQAVTLASDDPSIASVPASIKIPQGSTSVAVPVTLGIKSGTVNVTAQAAGFASGSAVVNVKGSTLTISLDNSTVGLSRTVQGSVHLADPAPAGGVVITLAATPGGIVDLQPAQITISGGASSGTFNVTGSATGAASISASAPGYGSASANVNVVIFGTISMPANLAVGLGKSATLNVSLPVAAPAAGATVTLTSSDANRVTVTPSSVFIPAGAKTPGTQPEVNGMNVGSAKITASTASYNSASTMVDVNATVSFSPSTLSIIGAKTRNITLTLSAAAPIAGLTVNLSSDNPAVAKAPDSITFQSNQTSVNVPVTSLSVGTATIHASLLPNIPDTTATITVSSEIILPDSINLAPGQSLRFPLSLVDPAPANMYITLSSSDPSVTVSPESIMILQGAKAPTVQPMAIGNAFGSAVITASVPMVFLPARMQAKVGATASFYPQSLTLQGILSKRAITLVLYGPDGSRISAPASGLTFNITSDNPAVATVTPSVTFTGGSSEAPLIVTAIGIGATNIRTSLAPYVAETIAGVTVVDTGVMAAPPTLTVGLGQTAPFPITLGNAAPDGGVTLTLASSDAMKVSIAPQSVTIPAGQTQPASQPQVTGNGIGAANITASASGGGYAAVSGLVTVPAPTLAFSGPATVLSGGSGTVTLNLSGGQGPSGGLTVDLASDKKDVAAVPATVTFGPGQTSVPVTVSGGSVSSQQTATITASVAGIPQAAKAVVTVNPKGGIQVSNVTAGTNQTATVTITLPGATPTTETVVALASSNGSIATISPSSITIPAGSSSGSATITGVSGGTADITASASGYSQGSGTVTVTSLVLTAEDLTLASGAQGTVNLKLTGGQAPSGGLTVNLVSANTNLVTVAQTATFAANATTTTATVNAASISDQAQNANITATSANLTATAKVTVTPLPTVTLSAATVALGKTADMSITLANTTGSDLTISFTSSSPAIVPAPADVVIKAGSKNGAVTVKGNGIGSVTITASASGYASGTATATVAAPVASFSPATLTVDSGATGTLTVNLDGGQAPDNGFTLKLTSANTSVATVPDEVKIEAGKTSATVTVTGVGAGTAQISATAAGLSTPATATVTVPGSLSLSNVTLGLGMTASMQVTLATAAPDGGATVKFTSSDAAKVPAPANVVIPAGEKTGAASISAAAIGTATINATATGYTGASATVTVTAPVMTLTPDSLSVNAGGSGTLTLSLSGGKAPTGGLQAALLSSDASKASVPGTVTINAGETSGIIAVTGVAATGNTPVTIKASATGLADASAAVTVNQLSVSLSSASVGLGMSTNLTVTLSQASASPVTVKFSTNKASAVPAPADIVIPANSKTGTVAVTGEGIGSATLTADATGYASGTSTVAVTAPSMSFSGSPLTLTAGASGNLTLNLANGKAPSAGLVVSLASSDATVATVGPTATFGAGSTSTQIPIGALVAGAPVTITASAQNITSATATVNVQVGVASSALSLQAATVGQNLETTVTISVTPAAPSGGLNVKITSMDPDKVLVAGRQTESGSQQTVFTIPQGQSSATFYVQGLLASGTGTIQASAPGYSSGSASITLTPSGFLLSGPNGASSFTTNLGSGSTSLTVYAARLDASRNFVEYQRVRPGVVASVAIQNSLPAVGTADTTVVFGAGDNMMGASFTPAAGGGSTGTATLTAVAPAGFSTPASGNIVTAIVNGQGLVCDSVTVGKNLEATATCTLLGKAPAGGLQVVITSGDASQVRLSTTATGAGSGSITVTVPGNQRSTPTFYVYGLASSGSVNYTAAANGFSSGSGTVTLARSGFVLGTPSGIGTPFTMVDVSTAVYVYPAQLDGAGNYVAVQPLAGGVSSATITLSNDNSTAGTLSPQQVTLSAGANNATAAFYRGTPATTQVATLTIPAVTGFDTPLASYRSVQGTVFGQAPLRLTCNGAVIGQNLQEMCTVSAAIQAKALTVTLTSGSASLLLAANATDAGSSSITLTIPVGGASATYYAQALADSGDVTHTAAADGYATQTATVTLARAAVIVAGQAGYGPFTNFFNAAVGGGPINLSVYTALVTADNRISLQSLRGGMAALRVDVASSDTSIGTVVSPVTIAGGSGQGTLTFTPLTVGSTSVILTEPAGFITPPSWPANSYVTLRGTVY